MILLITLMVLPIQVISSRHVPEVQSVHSPRYLDLSTLDQNYNGESDRMKALIPKGLKEFASIPYRIQGVIRPGGSSNETGSFVETTLKVNDSFSNFYFLHGVEGETDLGIVIAEFLIHYQDGGQMKIPVEYGVHVLSWKFWEYIPPRDSSSKMVWVGQDSESKSNHSAFRLFHTPWRNPHPDRVVESIVYSTTQSECRPFVLAMTLD